MRILRFCAIIAAVALLALPSGTSAQTVLTPEKLDVIRLNCKISQGLLSQQLKRDAVTRVNYGRGYDGLGRQMAALNSRFAINKVDAAQAVRSASDFQAAVDRFKASYNRYDDLSNDATSMDCQEDSQSFYELLERARQDRKIIFSDITEVGQILGVYRQAIVDQRAAAEQGEEETP